VDTTKTKDLDAMFVLAQQLVPILAEGTKGNPRQVKRFLNALSIRLAIANERGFADKMNPAVLGKLMLAERFQQDFYDLLAEKAMLNTGGEVAMLAELETAAREDSKKAKEKKPAAGAKTAAPADDDIAKWLSRDWLTRWLRIEPPLAGVDLRPYVFVARDKRILSVGAAASDLEVLIQTLTGSEMAARGVEPQIKELTPPAAEQVFAALRDRVLRGGFADEPSGFLGLTLVAKHHARYQSEILSLLSGIDHRQLGMWVTKGWNEALTDAGAKEQLRALLTTWASQDDNGMLKRAASQALSPAAPRGAR
jgi:hypothetical protein